MANSKPSMYPVARALTARRQPSAPFGAAGRGAETHPASEGRGVCGLAAWQLGRREGRPVVDRLQGQILNSQI